MQLIKYKHLHPLLERSRVSVTYLIQGKHFLMKNNKNMLTSFT